MGRVSGGCLGAVIDVSPGLRSRRNSKRYRSSSSYAILIWKSVASATEVVVMAS